jgi:hypothetical protein
LSREALDYYRQKDIEGKPRQDKLDAIAVDLANQQIGTSKVNTAAAAEQLQRYRTTGVPAEDAMYRDAAGYDTTARQEDEAGKAATDVDFAMGAAMDTKRRTMARAGVNPADGRALSMEQDAATAGALGKAAAMNGARTKVKDMGIMLRKDAANFARGMSGSAAQTFGTAAMAGQGATGAMTSAAGAANAGTAQMGQGFGVAGGLNNSGGSLLNQEYQSQAQANASGGIGAALGGIGALGKGLGAMGVVFSDKDMKHDVENVDGKAALDGIAKTDVKAWKYKDDSPAADGGQQHVGAMAQDMQKHLGDTVAPGGKMVDIVSALGVNMAATKALNKKVDSIAANMARKGTKT